MDEIAGPLMSIPECAPSQPVPVERVPVHRWVQVVQGLGRLGLPGEFLETVRARGWMPYMPGYPILFCPERMERFAVHALRTQPGADAPWVTPAWFGEIVSILLLNEIAAFHNQGVTEVVTRHAAAFDQLADQLPDGARLLDLLYAAAATSGSPTDQVPDDDEQWARDLLGDTNVDWITGRTR